MAQLVLKGHSTRGDEVRDLLVMLGAKNQYKGTFKGFYYWTINTFDWCNKNHFDYRNLIPMNIAIDATNLDIY